MTQKEDRDYKNRFEIPLLTSRLKELFKWTKAQKAATNLPIALFGIDTGAAAALNITSEFKGKIAAIVCHGGRVDLASKKLSEIECPILLIVGEKDKLVLNLNEKAFEQLETDKKLREIDKAYHNFEKSGVFEKVIESTIKWFDKQL